MEKIKTLKTFSTELEKCLFFGNSTIGPSNDNKEKIDSLLKKYKPSFEEMEIVVWSCLFGKGRLRNEARDKGKMGDGYAYEHTILWNINHCFNSYFQHAITKEIFQYHFVMQNIKFLQRIENGLLEYFRGKPRFSGKKILLDDHSQQEFLFTLLRTLTVYGKVGNATRSYLTGWMHMVIGGNFDLEWKYRKFLSEQHLNVFPTLFTADQMESIARGNRKIWE